jgi:hypothetical protein
MQMLDSKNARPDGGGGGYGGGGGGGRAIGPDEAEGDDGEIPF